MTEPRQLSNPPIREAIIDIRMDLPAEAKIDALRRLAESQRDAFPKLQERRRLHGECTVRGQEAPQVLGMDLGVNGFLLRSADDLDVMQFRLEGVAVNRLTPYKGWDELLASARRAFDRYAEAVNPLAIARVSTRFINRILLPLPIADFADYMACPPRMPFELPQQLSGFFQRVEVSDPKARIAAQITQAFEAPKDNLLPWIVDIDAFCLGPMEPVGDSIWRRLEELHSFKNRVFFGSITEKTLGLLT